MLSHRSSCVVDLLPWLGVCLLIGSLSASLQADTTTIGMLSIEWLVDESDVIAIVKSTENPSAHRVAKIIKGNAASIDWSKLQTQKREHFFEPPGQNLRPSVNTPVARVLFIRGQRELLQAVRLERDGYIGAIDKAAHPDYKPYPRRGVESNLYGVTQFGELLLTEPKLLQAIENRMKAVHEPVKLRAGVDKHLGKDGSLPARYAAELFPLNNDDEVYYLVVPFDSSRRDYLLNQLAIGDAAEKLYALNELSIFDDEKARQAIERAVDCQTATEVFHFDKGSGQVVAWTAADVRAAAKAVATSRP